MKPRLLYVDDDEDIRAIVQMALDLDGHFEAEMATSGEEALARLAAGMRPDVIVLDVMMPGMDGLTLLDRIRDLSPEHGPVLFMTAKGRQADMEMYRQRGACGVIVKPFDPVRLGAEIRARTAVH